MNVALCTFFCAQRHIHTLARDTGTATDDADEEKGAPGPRSASPLIIRATPRAHAGITSDRTRTQAGAGGEGLDGAEAGDGAADEVVPFLAQPRLVGFGCLGEREPGAAEHPEGEPDQAAQRPVRQVTGVDQGGDVALDEAV